MKYGLDRLDMLGRERDCNIRRVVGDVLGSLEGADSVSPMRVRHVGRRADVPGVWA